MTVGFRYQRRRCFAILRPEPAKFPNGFGKMISRYQSGIATVRLVWRLARTLRILAGCCAGKQTGRGRNTRHLYRTADGKIMPNGRLQPGATASTGTGMKSFSADGIRFCKGRRTELLLELCGKRVSHIGARGKGNAPSPGRRRLLTWMVPVINCMGMAMENMSVQTDHPAISQKQ